jgi:hypothetical protein
VLSHAETPTTHPHIHSEQCDLSFRGTDPDFISADLTSAKDKCAAGEKTNAFLTYTISAPLMLLTRVETSHQAQMSGDSRISAPPLLPRKFKSNDVASLFSGQIFDRMAKLMTTQHKTCIVGFTPLHPARHVSSSRRAAPFHTEVTIE